MSSISSDALFHFTKNPEYLIGILENEFQPRFCLEEVEFKTKTIKVAFPMVCFCDLPLSQIKNHLEIYGNYGIGMKKEWAEKMKLNPILYLRKKSSLAALINTLFVNVQDKAFLDSPILKKTRTEILGMLRFLKTYKGDLPRVDKVIKNVNFYNEREWRYIPDIKENSFLTEPNFQDELKRAEYNAIVKTKVLKFEPNDIKYIFVKDEKEISSMVSALKRIKSKFNQETIEILTSRIITCEQILNDF